MRIYLETMPVHFAEKVQTKMAAHAKKPESLVEIVSQEGLYYVRGKNIVKRTQTTNLPIRCVDSLWIDPNVLEEEPVWSIPFDHMAIPLERVVYPLYDSKWNRVQCVLEKYVSTGMYDAYFETKESIQDLSRIQEDINVFLSMVN